jgi:hypothetical protein
MVRPATVPNPPVERWRQVIRRTIPLLFLLAICPIFAFAQESIAISVTNSPVPSGTPATISISVTDSNTGLGVQDTGSCKIVDSTANSVEVDPFSTDSSGNAKISTSGTLGVGNYTADCSTIGNGDGINTFTVVPGACTATDASSEDLSSAPSTVVFGLTVTLDPTPPTTPPVTQKSGYGVTGTSTGVYDCSANPLTTSPQRSDLEALGYITRSDGGIDFSWRIHNYGYQVGPACTSGNCNGSQSLGVTESAPLNVTLTFYCF